MHNKYGYLFLKWKQLCKLMNIQKAFGRMENDKLEPLVDSFHQVVVVWRFSLCSVCQNYQVDSMFMSLVRISIVM